MYLVKQVLKKRGKTVDLVEQVLKIVSAQYVEDRYGA